MALHDVTLRVILHHRGEARPCPDDQRTSAVRTLLDRGFAVSSRRNRQEPFAPSDEPVLVVEMDPGADIPGERQGAPHWFRWNGTDPSEIAAAAEQARGATAAPEPGAWLPWFPVIDYDRCTNCMQCLSFCLFGVYGVDPDGRIQAQQQDHCKTNCPACSRVCPEAAIMFPKYKAGPINGDVVSDTDLQREKMKIDISALLGGDVYALLRDRSQRARSRFSKERDSDKALAERQKCLTKLGEIMKEVPPEVLASLPSPEEINRKAAEARERALKVTAPQPAEPA